MRLCFCLYAYTVFIFTTANDLLKNAGNQLQACAEYYTDAYLQAEKDILKFTLLEGKAKGELGYFLQVNKEYFSDLKKEKRRTRANNRTREEQELLDNELQDLYDEQEKYEEGVKLYKTRLAAAKAQLKEAMQKPENQKAFGQPVFAKLDSILKEYGIDRSAMFGGAIQGNGCRKLMEHATSILFAIREHVLNSPSRIVGIPDEDIRRCCAAHVAALHSLDGFLACMHVKRFHLTEEVSEDGKKYRDKFIDIQRYLGMSVTHKSHLVDKHACQQQIELHGFGDIHESFGELHHKLETIADRRFGAARDFHQRELMKIKEEAQENDPNVKQKKKDIQASRKRKTAYEKQTGAQESAEKKRRQREENRLASLEFCVPPNTKIKCLRQLRKEVLLQQRLAAPSTP
jgi:hypothetical protein